MASCLSGGHYAPGSQEYVPVAEFYADKSVFVTGGTGFMGKVRESEFFELTYLAQVFHTLKFKFSVNFYMEKCLLCLDEETISTYSLTSTLRA